MAPTAPEITAETIGALRITYESRPCTRCGGSGHFSYNSLDGTMCYGCSGAGRKLTKRGATAAAAVTAKMDELLSVPVLDLAVGDKVWARTMGGHMRWLTVGEVKRTGRSAGRYRVGGEGAPWIEKPEGVHVELSLGGRSPFTSGVNVEAKFRRYDRDAMVQVYRYAATLAGATVEPKAAK